MTKWWLVKCRGSAYENIYRQNTFENNTGRALENTIICNIKGNHYNGIVLGTFFIDISNYTCYIGIFKGTWSINIFIDTSFIRFKVKFDGHLHTINNKKIFVCVIIWGEDI